jgi:ABC-type Fe3+/spermidine/putrescine transport system ATPase subunit
MSPPGHPKDEYRSAEHEGAPTTLLELRGVDAWYGAAQVVRAAALSVTAGEVVALIGRNGAGKTSLLRAIMGLMPRSAGDIVFDGEVISGRGHAPVGTESRVRQRTGGPRGARHRPRTSSR